MASNIETDRQWYRIRVICEGAGIQISGLEERIVEDELPADPLERIAALIESAATMLRSTMEDYLASELELANDHPLPPGLAVRPPDALSIMIEPIVVDFEQSGAS